MCVNGLRPCVQERILLDWENVDLMEGRRLRAGPGKARIEAPATPVVANKTKGGE